MSAAARADRRTEAGEGTDPLASPDRLLDVILNGLPQPVYVVDAAGRLVFANPAAIASLGYDDLSELRGKPAHATVHTHEDGTPLPEAECRMLRARESGATLHGEDEWFCRRDGSTFPIAWWSAPIELPSGRGAVLAFTDISERRAAEQAIRDRDAAEVRAAEARAAQRRIVEAGHSARRRLARDLHDGAQQQLISLLLSLQLASEEVAEGGEGAQQLLDEAVQRAQAAIRELRELSSGVHPTVLSTRGLTAALEELAARAPVPVHVEGSIPSRLPEATETAAYFFVAEALTNVVKHARASAVTVAADVDADRLLVAVSDDGIGGARAQAAGSGLAGLIDRIGALGGTVELESKPGRGTRLRARLPAT